MAFEVNLTIRGLCAFVPGEPIQFGQPQKRMKVLVMDARQPRTVSNRSANSPEELEICAHLPLLRFSHPDKNVPRGFWILNGHRIEILGIDTRRDLIIDSSFEEGAFMERVVMLEDQTDPTQADVDPKFLESPFPLEPLVATMDLEAGRVEAIDLTGFWKFEPPPTPPRKTYEGFFRAAVRVTIPIEGKEAELHAISQRGGNNFVQRLSPKEEDGTSVELLLSNLCLEDDAPTRRTVEGDFAVFYDLLPKYKGTLRVPHLINQQKPNGVPAQANNSPSCAIGVMRAG